MEHFQITLPSDPDYATKKARAIARLTRRCPQCLSRVGANVRNVGYSDGTCDWCRGDGDYVG